MGVPTVGSQVTGHGPSPPLRAAGADKVVETQEISGLRIWDIITRPVVTAILDKTLFGQANLNVAEVPVPEGSSLVGKPVPELNLEQHYNLILLGVVDRLRGTELDEQQRGYLAAVD